MYTLPVLLRWMSRGTGYPQTDFEQLEKELRREEFSFTVPDFRLNKSFDTWTAHWICFKETGDGSVSPFLEYSEKGETEPSSVSFLLESVTLLAFLAIFRYRDKRLKST